MEVQRYRKKPVVIDAVQWDGDAESATPIIDWILSGGGAARFHDEDGPSIVVDTLEGPHRGSPGDWFLRGVKGEHYPVKPDIFEMTYEPEST